MEKPDLNKPWILLSFVTEGHWFIGLLEVYLRPSYLRGAKTPPCDQMFLASCQASLEKSRPVRLMMVG
jgi:hypothetical protein